MGLVLHGISEQTDYIANNDWSWSDSSVSARSDVPPSGRDWSWRRKTLQVLRLHFLFAFCNTTGVVGIE